MKCIKGDIFAAIKDSKNKVMLPHCCNDFGAIGGGFTSPLIRNYPTVRDSYLKFYDEGKCVLGAVDFVTINKYLIIGNMIGQHGLISPNNPQPVKYDALEKAMKEVSITARGLSMEIVTIPFGTGLAGGTWTVIKKLIETLWEDDGLIVTVYDNMPNSVMDEK